MLSNVTKILYRFSTTIQYFFTEKGKFLAMRTVRKLIEAERNAFNALSEDEQAEAVRISKKHYELLKEEFGKVKGENK